MFHPTVSDNASVISQLQKHCSVHSLICHVYCTVEFLPRTSMKKCFWMVI